jgi:Kef-type K+ transport system membrane component KefB
MDSLLTLAAGEASGLAVDLLKVLACAGAVAIVLGRLKLAAIPGYLIAGAVIGPHAIGLISGGDQVAGIADLAVVLLMFGIGLHLDVAGMRRGAVSLIAIGTVSTIASSVLLTPVGMAFGLGWEEALAIGMALSMSSTAVVLRVIQQRRELHRAYGRLSFGILLIQDLLVIGMLAFLPTLAGLAEAGAAAASGGVVEGAAAGDDGGVLPVIGSTMLRISALALMLVVGKLALPRLMLEAAKRSSGEVMLVVAAAVALGSAVLAGALGLSPALGSFIAGFLLASTPFRFQVSGQMTPLRDLFMAVFFTAVGLQLDVAAVAPLWWVVAIGFVAMVVIKVASIALPAWAFGASAGPAGQSAVSLSQAGEFSLVVLGAGTAIGLISADSMSVSIAVVVLSLIVTPALMTLGRTAEAKLAGVHTAPWLRKLAFADTPKGGVKGGKDSSDAPSATDGPDMARCPAIIAGYGPVGRACADRLVAEGVPVTIIEMNPRTVKLQRQMGRSIVYGDVTNAEVLESAGVVDADAVVLTIPDEDAMLRACRAIRAVNPRAFIAARAGVLSKGLQARELGADHVTVEEIATADAMAKQVLDQLNRRVGTRKQAGGEVAE